MSRVIVEMARPRWRETGEVGKEGRRLAAKGFKHCIEFPSDIKGRFSIALALSAMSHIQVPYPSIHSYLEKTWKLRKIPQLVQFLASFPSFEAIFSTEAVWPRLRTMLKDMYQNYFDGDSQKMRDFVERGDINPGVESAWTNSANLFMLTVFLIQGTEGGCVQKVYYPSDFGFVSVLFLVNDILYQLLHDSLFLGQPGVPGFPFYLSRGETFSVLEETEVQWDHREEGGCRGNGYW